MVPGNTIGAQEMFVEQINEQDFQVEINYRQG
jgi:hypothetical protein